MDDSNRRRQSDTVAGQIKAALGVGQLIIYFILIIAAAASSYSVVQIRLSYLDRDTRNLSNLVSTLSETTTNLQSLVKVADENKLYLGLRFTEIERRLNRIEEQIDKIQERLK